MTDVDATPEQAVTAAYDDTPAADSQPAATESQPAESTEFEAPAVIEWNGELESVKDADWFKALDTNLQSGIAQGLEAKYQNWQRGYTDKFQDIARQRKSIDAKLVEVRDQEQRVQKWLHGDIDPLVEKQREIDNLKIAHSAAMGTLREQFEDATEKMKTSRGSDYETAVKERDEAVAKAQKYETAATARDEAETEHVVDQFEQWLKSEAPDVYDNDEAFYSLCVLCTGGVTPEDAVQMVRGKYGTPQTEVAPAPENTVAPAPTAAPEPQPESLPDGMKLMNMGPDSASATATGETRSFDDIMEQMRRSATREQSLLLGS